MSGPPVPCNVCGTLCHAWRQCPDNTCRKDIAYCKAHAGDDLAIEAMILHIKSHAPRPKQDDSKEGIQAGGVAINGTG